MPHLAPPSQTWPGHALPRLVADSGITQPPAPCPARPDLATPNHAVPYLASPCRAPPRLTVPYLT